MVIPKDDWGCKLEIERLAGFILENYPEEIGRGNFKEGESAVDIVIRLLKKKT